MKKYIVKIIVAILMLVLLIGGTALLNLPQKEDKAETEPTQPPVRLQTAALQITSDCSSTRLEVQLNLAKNLS